MTPDWLNDNVQAFGRQMGLSAFRLAENGAAGVRFENGIALRFEYADAALMVSVGVPVEADEQTLKRLLTSAHPSAARQLRLRAAYLAKAGEALLAVRLAEREVTVTALEAVFRMLWSAADRLRRAAA